MDTIRFEMFCSKIFLKILPTEIRKFENMTIDELIGVGYSDDDIRNIANFILTGKELLKESDKYKINMYVLKNSGVKNIDNEDVDIDDLEGEYDL